MVVLTIAPPWGRPTVPIGLGYLSRYLEAHRVDHQVVDLNLEIWERAREDPALAALWEPQQSPAWVDPRRFAGTLAALEPLLGAAVERLLGPQPSLVGFSLNQSNARLSLELARRLRERCPGTCIVFGGPGVYLEGERRLIPEGAADLFVLGEGELALLEVVRRFEAGQPLGDVPGTLRQPGGENPPVGPRLDLGSALGLYPTYARFELGRYPGGGAPLPLLAGRGCVCRCAFCGDYPFWGRFRPRPSTEVLAEIQHHVDRHGIRRFELNDLSVNGDLRNLEAICDGIIAAGLTLEWSSYAYLRPMPTPLLGKLRRAGCVMLRFGLESGSDAVLRRMRKPHRAGQAASLLRAVASAGIRCNVGLMVGFPEETEAELEETCAFLRAQQQHLHEVDSISLFYLKPLSEVERDPGRFGVILPKDSSLHWNRWRGRDGSSYEQRLARAERLIATLAQTSIRFQRQNLYGL